MQINRAEGLYGRIERSEVCTRGRGQDRLSSQKQEQFYLFNVTGLY